MSATPKTKPLESTSPSISQTVVEKVAEAEGVTPQELDARLYDAIDPDALNDLLEFWDSESAPAGVVSFEFHGYEVTVQTDLTVELEPIQGE